MGWGAEDEGGDWADTWKNPHPCSLHWLQDLLPPQIFPEEFCHNHSAGDGRWTP